MADDRDNVVANIVAAVPSIPATAKPGVIKALSYLLGGAGNYFGAWLRRPAQAVEDGTSARSIVTTALAQAAAERAVADPLLVDAALQQWTPGTIARQANKARIAQKMLEELETSDEPFIAGEPISDDFLNSFEKFCEDASSEDMQRLWARVLAGELKRPGSFSRRALRVLYDLDSGTAKLFETAAYDVVGGIMLLAEEEQDRQLVPTLELEAAGLLTGAGGVLAYNINADDRGLAFVEGETLALVIAAPAKHKMSLNALPLSAVGKQLLTLLPKCDQQSKLRAIAEQVRSKGALGAALAKIELGQDGAKSFHSAEPLWGENPFDRA